LITIAGGAATFKLSAVLTVGEFNFQKTPTTFLGAASAAFKSFDFSTCTATAKSSGDSCQPTCVNPGSVTTKTGDAYVLACDAAGNIGYRSTISAHATDYDTKLGAANTGGVTTEKIHEAGSSDKTAGSYTGVATTTTSANGNGCTVSYTVLSTGAIDANSIQIDAAGTQYVVDDIITITSTASGGAGTADTKIKVIAVVKTKAQELAAYGYFVVAKAYPYVAYSAYGTSETSRSLTCSANSCLATASGTPTNPNDLVSAAIGNIDYGSDCTGKSTGDTCAPVCAANFYTETFQSPSTHTTPLELVCDFTTGGFNGYTNQICTAAPCANAPTNALNNNKDYTSCASGVSGSICYASCLNGYTSFGGGVTAGISMECATAAGIAAVGTSTVNDMANTASPRYIAVGDWYDTDTHLDTGLQYCTANECEQPTVASKTAGYQYSDCTPNGATYTSTGGKCAVDCDASAGYATDLTTDVTVTVAVGGVNYHVGDILEIAASAMGANLLNDVPVLVEVATIGTVSDQDANGVDVGPVATVTVKTPAHHFRGMGVSATGAIDQTTPLTSVATALKSYSHSSQTNAATGATLTPSGATVNIVIKRAWTTGTTGANLNAGDVLEYSDASLGNGGGTNLFLKVLAAGSTPTVALDLTLVGQGNFDMDGKRRAGYYAGVTVFKVWQSGFTGDTSTGTLRAGAIVPPMNIIVPATVSLVCNEAPAVATKANTFDFNGAIVGRTCSPILCNKIRFSATAADNLVDYSSCQSKVAGQTCQPTCKGGSAITQQGTAFVLSCPAGWIDTAAQTSPTTCAAGSCNMLQVTNAQVNVDYTPCNGLNTGSTCAPICKIGTTQTSAGTPISLTCAINGQFDGTTNLRCAAVQCNAPAPTNAKPGVDYSSCQGKFSGENCFPFCQTGYSTNVNDPNGFTLDCTSGTYSDTGTHTCTANSCTAGPSSALLGLISDDASKGADCTSSVTGGTCAYDCKGSAAGTAGTNYYALSSSFATTFPLVCSANGYFTYPTSVSPCTPYACNVAATSGGYDAKVDYSSCDNLNSGATCTPTCKSGYVSGLASTGFEMECASGTGAYVVPLSSVKPRANPICNTNVCGGTATVLTGLDYTFCHGVLVTGQTCTPTCKTGYTCSSTPQSFTMDCDTSGAYRDTANYPTSGATVTVTPNRCMYVNPSEALTNVNYNSCTFNNVVTGSTCTPTCAPGYTATSAASPINLVCDTKVNLFNSQSGWSQGASSNFYFTGTNTIDCNITPTQTCAQLGWTKIVNNVCGEQDSKLGPGQTDQCYFAKTYAQALDICDTAGTRLCSQVEIDQGSAMDTGSTNCINSLGTTPVWTSTTSGCSAGQHIRSNPKMSGGYICTDDTSTAGAVQCCAGTTSTPTPPPPPPYVAPPPPPSGTSASTCAALGWTQVIGNVCGESDQGFNNGQNACYTTDISSAGSICTAAGARLCTAAEIGTGVTVGTGCNFDIGMVWTSNTCVLRQASPEPQRAIGYVAAMGNGNGQTECLTLSDNRPTRCCADTGGVSTQKTCAQLGWTKIVNDVCGESDAGLGANGATTCNTGKTYDESAAICSTAGARLCSVVEIDSGATAKTGCDFDERWIWTSDSCGVDQYWLAKGGGTGVRKCKIKTKTKNTRCCSDISLGTTKAPSPAPAPPPAPPTLSCATLGWANIVNNVCGESDIVKGATTKCYNYRAWQGAKTVCEAVGARLCTNAELAADTTKSTGCNFDSQFVWSSTACAGGYLAGKGNGDGTSECKATTAGAPVRCCADV
jgi:hypothetical protein